MSFIFYKIFHLGSLLALCLVLGAIWGIYIKTDTNKIKKNLMFLHGLILFLIFLAGFGLIAKTKVPFPWPLWIYGKIILWLLLGASPYFIRKTGEKGKAAKVFLLVLAGLWLLVFSGILIVLN